MRYFFEVVEAGKWVRDHEGGEYDGLGSAKAEAEQAARDMAAEYLQQGRALPLTGRIDIIDSFGQVCATVAFETAILEKTLRATTAEASSHRRPQPIVAMRGVLEEYRRANTLLGEAQRLMRTTFEEQRKQMAVTG